MKTTNNGVRGSLIAESQITENRQINGDVFPAATALPGNNSNETADLFYFRLGQSNFSDPISSI